MGSLLRYMPANRKLVSNNLVVPTVKKKKPENIRSLNEAFFLSVFFFTFFKESILIVYLEHFVDLG